MTWVGRGAFLAALMGFVVTAGASELKQLDGRAVEAAFAGKTLRLETPIGAIPISFKTDGTMVGRTQDLANWLGRGFDQGTWWIASDQLCQKWRMWLDGKSYCFTLRQSGSRVHWTRNDGLTGELTVVSK